MDLEMLVPLISVYCLLIVGASLVGGLLPTFLELTHARLQLLMSAIGGFMLGVGLFHLLPHGIVELGLSEGGVDRAIWWMVVGLLAMFFLIRAFHFHQHGLGEVEGELVIGSAHSKADHDSHAHEPQAGRRVRYFHPFSWVGIAIGLAVHSLIDGVALGTAVSADAAYGTVWSLLGFGTFLAILLHKPLDAVSITSLMHASGWSSAWCHVVNLGFALMCPMGAGLILLGVERMGSSRDTFIGCVLAFSAGVFLCISLGDLLPEIEFHAHDRVKLSVALLMGLLLAYGIRWFEPAHFHSHESLTEVATHLLTGS